MDLISGLTKPKYTFKILFLSPLSSENVAYLSYLSFSF